MENCGKTRGKCGLRISWFGNSLPLMILASTVSGSRSQVDEG